MTAAGVFIGMHSIDASKDGVPLRKVMACLDPCMAEDMRSSFPPESMAVALQQLVTRLVLCNTMKKDKRRKPRKAESTPSGNITGGRVLRSKHGRWNETKADAFPWLDTILAACKTMSAWCLAGCVYHTKRKADAH